MFKVKNYMTPFTTLGIYLNKPFTVYTNSITPNLISVSNNSFDVTPPLHYLTDFSLTSAIDICAFNDTKSTKILQNNLFYNYTFDIYINHITTGLKMSTNSFFFFNCSWLEREVSETFNINYTRSKDTRPLLLNYGEETGVLLKRIQTQPVFELKSNWQGRKIFKNVNVNVEL